MTDHPRRSRGLDRTSTSPASLLEWTAADATLMREGRHARLHDKLGAHIVQTAHGSRFTVWAPHARAVHVTGDFNEWDDEASPLALVDKQTGIWSGFVPNAAHGALYKYALTTRDDTRVLKADPFARSAEQAPGYASQIWLADHRWRDAAWLARRGALSQPGAPMSIYEVHLGSWMRVPEEGDRFLTYRELAPRLVEHVKRLGFTHVELMPLTEHPFYGSWGYETTGYFAATSRYGTPDELMALVDELHRADLGVLLDWVPGHFPNDPHGLARFDGTALYEHADPQLGSHPEWNTLIFDFGRPEVRSFLLSSATFWIDHFHVDGLRVDGVASMLYRDYGRRPGEWTPNRRGGRENLEAVELLQHLNDTLAREQPHAITAAEESTAWPKVTGATSEGGLGFTFKWDMGWMHDTLQYLGRDPLQRKDHHDELTMRAVYAFHERFILPLSHDEVVHGKRSLLAKLPGDRWQQFATLRLLYAYMFSQPGKKLLFMGNEFAQWNEWNHDRSLDWHLLHDPSHRQIELLVGTLNHLYRSLPALHHDEPGGFHWLADDPAQSLLIYERIARDGARIVCAFNFTPVPRHNVRIGVTAPGFYRELLNTDATELGGSAQGNLGGVDANPVRAHDRELSIAITVPPLGAVWLARGER